MGRLILCHGNIAKRPYYFHQTDCRVYTIEEVCYFISKNIHMLQGEAFDRDFVTWLRQELKMEEVACTLEQQQKDKADLKDIVETICRSCDYFDETQLHSLLKSVEQTEHLPLQERKKVQADLQLQSGYYERALESYVAILKSDEIKQANPVFIGLIYHNIGVAYSWMGEYAGAAEAFLKAYDNTHREDSLKSYLLAQIMTKKAGSWRETCKERNLSNEKINEFLAEYDEMAKKASVSAPVRRIRKMRHLLEQGKQSELMDKVSQNINEWKEEYRQQISL